MAETGDDEAGNDGQHTGAATATDTCSSSDGDGTAILQTRSLVVAFLNKIIQKKQWKLYY